MQSFAWSDKIQGTQEEELNAAIQSQREYLSEFPHAYELQDVLSADPSLLNDIVTKTADNKRNKSLVKTIIIGDVPDRGGRVDEARPKSSSSDNVRKTNDRHGKPSFRGHDHNKKLKK